MLSLQQVSCQTRSREGLGVGPPRNNLIGRRMTTVQEEGEEYSNERNERRRGERIDQSVKVFHSSLANLKLRADYLKALLPKWKLSSQAPRNASQWYNAKNQPKHLPPRPAQSSRAHAHRHVVFISSARCTFGGSINNAKEICMQEVQDRKVNFSVTGNRVWTAQGCGQEPAEDVGLLLLQRLLVGLLQW